MTDYYLGEIRLFAGNFAPMDWAICDGSLLKIKDYDELYSLIGTTYGGDGTSTFALPDLRGRVAVGTGTGQDEGGKSLTPRSIGEIPGYEQIALTADNTPPHSHAFLVSSAPATTPEPAGTGGTNIRTFGTFTKDNQVTGLYSSSVATSAVTLHRDTLRYSESPGMPHDNMMGSRTINYIIALDGSYPGRN